MSTGISGGDVSPVACSTVVVCSLNRGDFLHFETFHMCLFRDAMRRDSWTVSISRTHYCTFLLIVIRCIVVHFTEHPVILDVHSRTVNLGRNQTRPPPSTTSQTILMVTLRVLVCVRKSQHCAWHWTLRMMCTISLAEGDHAVLNCIINGRWNLVFRNW
jgi:hypothetical protein